MNKGEKHHTKKRPYERRNYAKDYMYMQDFMKQGGNEGRKKGSNRRKGGEGKKVEKEGRRKRRERKERNDGREVGKVKK
jgi:hypothetical protein